MDYKEFATNLLYDDTGMEEIDVSFPFFLYKDALHRQKKWPIILHNDITVILCCNP